MENVLKPGQVTTMKGMLIYGDDFSKAEGLNQCWQKDTTAAADVANTGWEVRRQMIIVKLNPAGTFSFCVPLKHLFGFCDDYTMVVYGVKHSLLFSGKLDDEVILRDNAVSAGVNTLTKLS